jgi:leucyl-tRNA synthetase
MIAVNELQELKCHKREILAPLLVLMQPYAPHITEELNNLMGGKEMLGQASFPAFDEKYVKEFSKAYPVAINGKTRTELTIDLEASQSEVEKIVLNDHTVQKWLEGKNPKKVIYVKNKMINVVV